MLKGFLGSLCNLSATLSSKRLKKRPCTSAGYKTSGTSFSLKLSSTKTGMGLIFYSTLFA
jgi:hypothetical protein